MTDSNRGTGAGGACTTLHGGAFEARTSPVPELVRRGWQFERLDPITKYGWAYTKLMEVVPGDPNSPAVVMFYCEQNGLKKLLQKKAMHQLPADFRLGYCPDGAYVTCYRSPVDRCIYLRGLHIVEKKSQKVDGSTAEKLHGGRRVREGYEIDLPVLRGHVQYAYLLDTNFSNRLDRSDPKHYQQLNMKDNIPILKETNPAWQSELLNWAGVPAA